MALTVEDGTGVAGADAYASLVDTEAWLRDHGFLATWETATDGSTEFKEICCREGASYIDSAYTWPGRRVNGLQTMAWPRYGVVYHYEILASTYMPPQLVGAQAYMAWERANGGVLQPSWSGAPVKSKSAGGGIGKTFGGAGDHPIRHFPRLDQLLAGVYRSKIGGGVLRMVRA